MSCFSEVRLVGQVSRYLEVFGCSFFFFCFLPFLYILSVFNFRAGCNY